MSAEATTHVVWLGQEQRRLRDAEGVTAEDLAEYAGCSRESILDYERGQVPRSFEVAVKIARRLGVGVLDLYREVTS